MKVRDIMFYQCDRCNNKSPAQYLTSIWWDCDIDDEHAWLCKNCMENFLKFMEKGENND